MGMWAKRVSIRCELLKIKNKMKHEYTVHLDDKAYSKIIANKNNAIIEIDGKYVEYLGFEIQSIDGYKSPDNFPLCCKFHIDLIERAKRLLDDEFDILIKDRPWLKKDNYLHIPEKIATAVNFTEYFISKKIQTEFWYKDITDYIEYVMHSFGSPPIGLSLFRIAIKFLINKTNYTHCNFTKEKKEQIILFIDKFNTANTDSQNERSLNRLYNTFQKWVEWLPKLNFFDEIRKKYSGKIPLNLMLSNHKFNPYLQQISSKILTEKEFIALLASATKNILSAIDTAKLIEQKVITDIEKYEIDLLNASHKIKQKQLTEVYSVNEKKYINIIAQWTKNEKNYLKELNKLFEKMSKKFTITQRFFSGKKPFLRISFKDKENAIIAKDFLILLNPVKSANVSNDKKYITIHLNEAFYDDVQEAINEISFQLEAFLQNDKHCTIFNEEADIDELNEHTYDLIIEKMYFFGQNLEKYPNVYSKFDEEGFRDYFLPHLNGISKKYTVTGETFNKKGKTDILIQNQDGIIIFMAECKLWKGETALLKAIDQLFDRYLNWRQERVALIIFNKDKRDFTDLIDKATAAVKRHQHYEQEIQKTYETSFRFLFKNPTDENRKVYLELVIFNFSEDK